LRELIAGCLAGVIASWVAEVVLSGDHGVVDSGMIGLARPQRGHFDLGTGYHGDVWLDLDALFLRPALLEPPC
jgi:hypothetical protein